MGSRRGYGEKTPYGVLRSLRVNVRLPRCAKIMLSMRYYNALGPKVPQAPKKTHKSENLVIL